jgi:hypothetical protein
MLIDQSACRQAHEVQKNTRRRAYAQPERRPTIAQMRIIPVLNSAFCQVSKLEKSMTKDAGQPRSKTAPLNRLAFTA